MQPNSQSPRNNRTMLMLIFGITLMVTMGISSVLPVLPQISRQFGIELESTWRVIASFALPSLAATPFVGVWADRYGRKAVLVPSLLLFALGGFACMFAQSYMQLLIFRVIQGIGSAPLGLLYPTIIADTWQGEKRIKAMSGNAIVLGLGTAFSPAIGGALAMVHWRLPFILPLCAIPLALFAVKMPLMKPRRPIPLRHYIRDLLACAQEKQTLALLSLTLLTFIMLSGPVITCFPMLAERLFQATPLECGLVLATASLASGVGASQLPKLYALLSTRSLLTASAALYTTAFCLMPLAPSLWWVVIPMFLYGAAQGLNIPLVSTLLTGQTTEDSRAALMAANAVLLRLGQNIGPLLFGTLAGIWTPGVAIVCGIPIAILMILVLRKNPLPSILSDNSPASSMPKS